MSCSACHSTPRILYLDHTGRLFYRCTTTNKIGAHNGKSSISLGLVSWGSEVKHCPRIMRGSSGQGSFTHACMNKTTLSVRYSVVLLFVLLYENMG